MIRDDDDVKKLLIATTELISENHFEEAENSLLTKLEEDPDNLEAQYLLGIMYTKKEKYSLALKHLYKIENSKKQSVYLNQARIIIGYIYAIQEEYIKAKEILIKVLDFTKNDKTAISILGYVYYKAKLYEQALKLYEKLLKIEPDNAKILNNIGFILVETKLNLRKGMDYIRKALRLKPGHPSYLDSLGWGHYLNGDYEQAVKTLKKAFELAPNSFEIKNHIREILNLHSK